MSEEKFTQGEWSVGRSANGSRRIVAKLGRYDVLSTVQPNTDSIYDAFLMKSAPKMHNLLSQCEAIIRQNKMHSPDGSRLTYDGRVFGADSLIGEISKLLAEVRGES